MKNHCIDPVASIPTNSVKIPYHIPFVEQRFLDQLTGLGVHHGYALLSCVQIATYNSHLDLLRPEPFWLDTAKVYSGRRKTEVLISSARCIYTSSS